MEKIFRFKKFGIRQDQCAMKVGTDGVLLGAWTTLEYHPRSILDIGAGTGLIALMLAQRSKAEVIDAVEIDENAFLQCIENFKNSPWSDRLICHHASLKQFAAKTVGTYDLIVSNPPFYTENVSSRSRERDLARKSAALPFQNLLQGVIALLAPGGTFCTIIPYREEARIIEVAELVGLYPRYLTRVKGNPTAVVKRTLLEFHLSNGPQKESEMAIETGRHMYTDDYIRLTKDFYLKM
jgi:tRNA1Val (adenine37-N6)-methyltransferase